MKCTNRRGHAIAAGDPCTPHAIGAHSQSRFGDGRDLELACAGTQRIRVSTARLDGNEQGRAEKHEGPPHGEP